MSPLEMEVNVMQENLKSNAMTCTRPILSHPQGPDWPLVLMMLSQHELHLHTCGPLQHNQLE